MAVSFSDISFVYSGGINNSDPNASLGGDASIHNILGNINNLFDDVLPTESEVGDIEYRAFYIFNDNETFRIRETKIWIESQVFGGAEVELGINLVDEIQKITIAPQSDISGGTFKIEISYGTGPTIETTAAITWNASTTILAQNIEDALNNLDKFSDVEVSAVASTTVFNVVFQGSDGNKKQPTLTIVDNLLTSTGDPASIDVELVAQGSPINTLAVDIGSENVPPSGIIFSNPSSEAESIEVGTVEATEGFPVWVKRTVLAETEGLEQDGFSFKFKVITP